MKLMTTAIASLALLGSFSIANAQGMHETRTRVVVHKEMHRGPAVKKVVIHRDHGRHEGWRHRDVKRVVMHRDRDRHESRHRDRDRHHGKTVIIKRGNHKTVIKKEG